MYIFQKQHMCNFFNYIIIDIQNFWNDFATYNLFEYLEYKITNSASASKICFRIFFLKKIRYVWLWAFFASLLLFHQIEATIAAQSSSDANVRVKIQIQTATIDLLSRKTVDPHMLIFCAIKLTRTCPRNRRTRIRPRSRKNIPPAHSGSKAAFRSSQSPSRGSKHPQNLREKINTDGGMRKTESANSGFKMLTAATGLWKVQTRNVTHR